MLDGGRWVRAELPTLRIGRILTTTKTRDDNKKGDVAQQLQDRKVETRMTRTPRPGYQRSRLQIDAKTYPNPSSKYDETLRGSEPMPREPSSVTT
jgi:hypothetical protein